MPYRSMLATFFFALALIPGSQAFQLPHRLLSKHSFEFMRPTMQFTPRYLHLFMIEDDAVETAASVQQVGAEAVASSDLGILDAIFHNPTFWSFNVMLVIVALLYSWEQFVEYAKEKTPPAIIPVIENILGEMGGLGFVGLVLSVLLNQAAFGEFVGGVSEAFLGEKDILLESFEFLHETFFQAAMAFFATAAFIIARVLWSFNAIFELSEEEAAATDKPTKSSPMGQQVSCNVASMLQAPTIDKASRIGRFLDQSSTESVVGLNDEFTQECILADGTKNALIRELRLTPKARAAEILIIRERLKREFDLPSNFEIQKYLENVFATAKLDFVEISPLSWLPLIPAIAAANAVDLSHEVLNPVAANAAESSGIFLSTPWFFYPKVAIDALCLGWGVHNFWKVASIKAMLVPTVVRLEGEDGLGRLLPPAIELEERRREFQAKSTPLWAKPFEELYAKAPGNRVEELFGTVGGNGVEFYLNSIKFHTWLVVASLVVFTSQILPRDIYALTHMDSVQVGDPDNLISEIVIFGVFALINIGQLIAQPITFLNYCLITCVEDNVDQYDLDRAATIVEARVTRRKGKKAKGPNWRHSEW